MKEHTYKCIFGLIIGFGFMLASLAIDVDPMPTINNMPVIVKDSIPDSITLNVDKSTVRNYKISNGQVIIKNVRPNFTETECLNLAALIYDECERTGIEYSYALALIQAESRFNYKAISKAGASGLMQIMPSTFVSIANKHGYPYKENDIHDLKKNVRIGMLFIHRLKKKYEKNELVSAGYNGGPKVALKYKSYLNGDKSASIPNETKKYVIAVNTNYQTYRKILGE